EAVGDLPTDTLLRLLEKHIALSFSAGFFTGLSLGISILLLKKVDTTPLGGILSAVCFTLLLMLFLTIHIHVRKRIVPELRKRFQGKEK
ncbi:MAG TPA: hypothetical protein VJ044_09445, partial [Candidatus Hodarchaeales archaeon]|nr:hypothetical protein [Candidatus Hodarchaeales archaeon]